MQEETANYIREKFKRYAELAGKLSAFLFEINNSKSRDQLSAEELNLLDHVREVVELATLIQRKINDDILKKLKIITTEVNALSDSNNELVEQIINIQEKSRILNFMAKSMQNPSNDLYTNLITGMISKESERQEDSED